MADVLPLGEIDINGLRYKLVPKTTVQLQTLQLIREEMREGAPFTRAEQPGVIRRVLVNTRGGLGLYRLRPEEGDQPVAFWDGLAWTLSSPIVPLPPLVSSAGQPSGSSLEIWGLFEYNDLFWAIQGNDVYYWAGPSGTTWSSSQRTLSAQAHSISQHMGSGTNRVFIFCGSAIDYYDGSSWAQLAGTNAHYGLSYNSFLWAISQDGTFNRHSTGIGAWGTWTARQALPIGSGVVLGLILYREPDGTAAIHAKTSTGLWGYDDTNDKWYETELRYPERDDVPGAFNTWRGLSLAQGERAGLHVGVGLTVYGYVAGDPAEISSVGPDMRDGVPSGYRGVMRSLAASHNFNLALVAPDIALESDAATDGATDVGPVGGSEVIPNMTGTTWVAAFTGLGWHKLWESASTDWRGNHLLISSLYGLYRAYWHSNYTVYYMALPKTLLNPREVPDMEWATSGRVIWPWDSGSAEGMQDTLIAIIIRTSGCTATETVTINYATDMDDSTWTAPNHTTFSAGVVTSNGLHTFTLGTSDRGVLFDFLRLRLQGARGTTTTAHPEVEYLAYEFLPGVPPILTWTCQVDLRKDVGQRGPVGMLTELLDLADPQILREVVWRAQSATTNQVHQCKLVRVDGAGQPGGQEYGVYTLTFLEPRPA